MRISIKCRLKIHQFGLGSPRHGGYALLNGVTPVAGA